GGRKPVRTDRAPSVYSGIGSRWWPMRAATSHTRMPTGLCRSSSAAAYPASAKLLIMASRWSGLAPYQRSRRDTSSPECQAGDPLGVVHARVGGHDHPGRVAVIG